VLGIIAFLIGLGLFAYPLIINMRYDADVEELQTQFFEDIVGNPENTSLLEQLHRVMVKYNVEIYEQRQSAMSDPFTYEQPSLDLSEYGIYDHLVGFITIPKMSVTLPIYLGVNDVTLEWGAAHMTESSFPVGGPNTNSVIVAQRNETTAMFRDIEKLEKGDEVIIRNFHETLKYRVSEIKIVETGEVDDLRVQGGRDLVTLVTSHPLDGDGQRYLVHCARVD